MRLGVVCALILLRTGCHAPAPMLPRPQPAAPATSTAADDPLRPLAQKVLAAANRERRAHGAGELVWDDALADQARRQSTNMMERGFFSHLDPVRGPLAIRLSASGIRWVLCAENLFRERGLDDPPEAAVDGWMKSPAHRAAMLGPSFTHSGVGIAISPDTEYFITEIFVRPFK
jgi:uncharacterized protein YkwD